jgi:tRNA(adenine34) deaminase
MVKNDTYFMKFALAQAKLAKENNEVPIGAVVVSENKVISRAHNMVELLNDSTAHAEILAITSASDYLNSKYLHGCTLYTTLEPCVMCYGAIYWSKISRIVYAVDDPAKGYKSQKIQLNKKIQETAGVLESESKDLIDKFFKKLRN